MGLRPYQVEAVEAVKNAWNEYNKTLLVLPTGTGKTICFSAIAEDRARIGRVLILAHREELLEQASDKLFVTTGLKTVLEKAENTCIDSDIPVVVGSVQTLSREKRLAKFDNDYFSTIIVDEAHHALATSYQNVLNHFSNAKVLGVTATPDRGDMKNLGEYFESLAYEYSLRDAINQGYLCPIRAQTMPLNIDMTNAKVSCGDYQDSSVGELLEPYLEDIADEMAKVCKNKHTVVFLPLVSTSQKFRDILNAKGFNAGEVNGETKNRKEILEAFEKGELNVLCNSMLLTEGWDCPIVDCIVVLRPTKIRSLYCQMIGRGTRLHEGKDHLLILDFLWMTGKHKLVHPADIICKKDEVADKITDMLSEDNEAVDLFAIEEVAERDVKKEREDALMKALKEQEAKRARQKNKYVDPLEYSLNVDNDITDYVPVFGWESEPITEKQRNVLEKAGIDPDAENMCKGLASKVIDTFIARNQEGLASPKQVRKLKEYGFKMVNQWTFEEANKMMSRLARAHWQPWRAGISVETYVPDRLKNIV